MCIKTLHCLNLLTCLFCFDTVQRLGAMGASFGCGGRKLLARLTTITASAAQQPQPKDDASKSVIVHNAQTTGGPKHQPVRLRFKV